MHKDRNAKDDDEFNLENYKYDITNLQRGLFEAFYDQLEVLKETDPKELNENTNFWRIEDNLTERAKAEIQKFERLDPTAYDICKVKPLSYNLSIQYEREKKAEDAKKAKEK